MARTDLAGPELTEPLARAAYRSLHQRLLPLPDELAVYPTHGAGSFCAAPVGGERSTTIGAERRHNRLLAATDEDAFVAELLAGFGSYPPYFLRLRERNRVGPELLGADWRALPLVSTDQVRAHLDGGGVLVDARPVAAFAAGHIPGALSITLRPAFASWLGWLVDDARPLVFVLDEDQDREELVRQCRTIGYDHLVGELAGGMAAWRAAGLPEARLPVVQAERLDDQPGVVLDVRQASEVADGHLPGAVAVELGALAGDRLPAAAPGGAGHGDVWARRAGHDRRQPAGAGRPPRSAGRGRRPATTGSGPPARPWPAREPAGTGPPRWAAAGVAGQPGPVLPPGRGQRPGRRHGRPGTHLLSLLATQVFGLAAVSAALTYIVAFGLTKAATNFLAGTLADRYGRKPVLVAGWLIGLPVPLLIIWAPTWSWIVAANVLLGINQGLCWSTTVIMKIDLAGPKRRGLAMGLNEAAGYLAVALTAYLTGLIAARAGLRPEPFYLGLAYAGLGLGLSTLLVRETRGHAQLEAQLTDAARTTVANPGPNRTLAAADVERPSTREVFVRTSLREPALSACSQAGLVNNLNDGLVWGLLPLLFVRGGLPLGQVGLLAALYPAVWGLGQLITGPLSDRLGRKPLITGGMLLQAAALAGYALAGSFLAWAATAILLGVGTAMVYPTLLAAISDVAHPSWRASAVGVYRLWRDAGFAVGALLAGLVADLAGLEAAVWVVAALTAASGARRGRAHVRDPPSGGQGMTADRAVRRCGSRPSWPPTCCPSTGSWPTRSPTGWAARSSWWSAAPSTSSNTARPTLA